MNISIRHIQHFIAVAEELHFRRAAQLTNVAQPALSRSVQTLESELGVQLLARNNRNVKLTAAGKEFLTGCTDMIAAMEISISKTIRADQSQFGGINIGYTYIAMCGKLPKLIAAFEQQYPTINIEPTGANTAPQLEQLRREELDFCFVSGSAKSALEADTESVVFQTDPFAITVSHDHPLANKDSVSIEELADEKLLLSAPPEYATFNQHITQLFDNAGTTANIEFVPQNHVGVLGRVALGRGVSIATEGYGCLYSEKLKTLKLTGTDARLPTHVVWRKNIHAESSIKFRDFVLQAIEEKIPTKLSGHTTYSALEFN